VRLLLINGHGGILQMNINALQGVKWDALEKQQQQQQQQ